MKAVLSLQLSHLTSINVTDFPLQSFTFLTQLFHACLPRACLNTHGCTLLTRKPAIRMHTSVCYCTVDYTVILGSKYYTALLYNIQ